MASVDIEGLVYARSEADVDATSRRVWSVLANIDGWPTWDPAVRRAELFGDLEVGARFRWAAGAGTKESQLTVVDAPRALAWRGGPIGAGHSFAWRIEPTETGCRVAVEAVRTGLLARLFSGRFQRGLQGDLDAWVRLLKLEAESRIDEDRIHLSVPAGGGTGHGDRAARTAPPPGGEAS